MDQLAALFPEADWELITITAMRIALILVVLWVGRLVVGQLLRRLERRLINKGQAAGEVPTESAKRAETLVRLLRQGVLILFWVVGVLLVLLELRIEIGPLLASAGIAGIALGFGAQNLVRDVIAGFFMIMENQVRVGDVAIVNGTGGLVEMMNFRTIVLRDLSGTVHVFPNGAITTLANLTREWSAYVFEIGVAYKEDPDRVISVMRRVGQELRQDPAFAPFILEDIEIFGVDDFADSAIVIKGRLKTVPIKQWELGREYRRRLKKTFDREGIEIPFPQRVVHWGADNAPLLAQLLNKSQAGSAATVSPTTTPAPSRE